MIILEAINIIHVNITIIYYSAFSITVIIVVAIAS